MSTIKQKKMSGVGAVALAATPATVTATVTKTIESPCLTVRKLKITDVVLGRGSGPSQKLGNIRFRDIVWTTFHDCLTSQLGRKCNASSSSPVKDGNDKDIITAIPDELYIKPINAATKNLIARRVAAKMKQSGCLFVRKLTEEEARYVNSGHPYDPSTAAAGGNIGKAKRKIVCDDEGSMYIEVSTKEVHEKIKQALRFQVQQKERELKGGDAAAAAAVAVAVDGTDRGCKKIHDMGVSQVSSPPPKKRLVKSLSSTIAPKHVPREIVIDRNASSGLLSGHLGLGHSLPMFNLLPRTTTMGATSSLSNHESVDSRSTGDQTSSKFFNTWLSYATAHLSQPGVFSQLSAEDVSELYLAYTRPSEAILSVASSSTTHRPVTINDILGRQQQGLTVGPKVQVAVARQQQQHHASNILSELGLHQQIKEELQREAVAQASRSDLGYFQGATGFTRQILHQLEQLRLLNQFRPLPRDASLTCSMECSTSQQRCSAGLDMRDVDDTSSLLLVSQVTSAAAPYSPPASTSLHDSVSQGQYLPR